MKKILVILLVVVALAAGVYFARNNIIKGAVSAVIKVITGLELSIDKFNIGIFKPVVDVAGLKLFNPPQFTDKLMMDLPQLYVDYDLGAILQGKIHLKDLKLNLAEFVVVKNASGALNIESLASLSKLQKKGGKPPKIQIDSLDLKIGKVTYKDYFNRAKPQVTEFEININEQYKNIDNPVTLVSLITTKALTHTTIASLANFDISPFTKSAEESLKGATQLVGEVANRTIEVGQKVSETAVGVVKNTTQKLKDLLLFGK